MPSRNQRKILEAPLVNVISRYSKARAAPFWVARIGEVHNNGAGLALQLLTKKISIDHAEQPAQGENPRGGIQYFIVGSGLQCDRDQVLYIESATLG